MKSKHRFNTEVVVNAFTRLWSTFDAHHNGALDMTERELCFESLFENLNDLVLLIGESGKVLYQTPSVAYAFGFTPDAFLGGASCGLAPSSEIAIIEAHIAQCREEPDVSSYRAICSLDHAGSIRTYEMTLTNCLTDPNSAGIIVVLHDVTERHALESELRIKRCMTHLLDFQTGRSSSTKRNGYSH